MLENRIHSQLLTDSSTDILGVVEHFCCMQAQNRDQHLRALGLRSGASKKDIYDAYNNGHLLRTWTQRGTIHTVRSVDAQRMLDLCASRTLSGFKRRRESLGLSDEITHRALDAMQAFLSGKKAHTRKEIVAHLEQKFASSFQKTGWGYHLTCYAATLGLIAMGPLNAEGKQAYISLAERVDRPRKISGEEALAELTTRYFSAHGPATIHDMARRSGLTKTQVKQGVLLCNDLLEAYTNADATYYHIPATSTSKAPVCHILAGFDEFLIGYKDRSATVADIYLSVIDKARNGIMKPTFMFDGETKGIRTIKKKTNHRDILIQPFTSISKKEKKLLEDAFVHYSAFVEKKLLIQYV